MSGPNFLAEFKRRNVHRAALVYAGAAWLLVQFATQVFPFFGIDDRIVRWVVVVLAVGFLPALIVAWFYEWTPDGIRRDEEVDHDGPEAAARGRRIDRVLIGVLTLAVVLLGLRLAGVGSAVPEASAPAADAGRPAAAVERSIAVLPFANLSSDPENAYFADGIQDEILTRLAKIGALKVISRTSTARYATRPGDLREIARQLGVANVLEGSVQRVGDQVRINVQLIEAETDSHLWAETYDRRLDDLFSIQSEVATAIATTLKATLSGGEREAMATPPTADRAAYDAYLRGLAAKTRMFSGSHEPVRRAAAAFREAVQRDPQFAQAWAQLAYVQSFMCFNLIDRTPALLGEARAAADTALRLRPDLGESHVAMGLYRYWGELDFDGGLAALATARRLLPNDADVLYAISLIERRLGRWDEAIAHAREAYALNPRHAALLATLAEYEAAQRRLPDALATLDRAIEIAPADTGLLATKIRFLLDAGDLDAAQQSLDAVPEAQRQGAIFGAGIDVLFYRRDYAGVIRQIDTLRSRLPAADLASSDGLLSALGFALLLDGQTARSETAFAESLQAMDALRSDDPSGILIASKRALTLAGLNRKAEAFAAAREAVAATAGDALNHPAAEIVLAGVAANLGEPDQALDLLRRLLTVPAGLTVAQLRFDPMWDDLRDDPRFRALIGTGPGR